MDTTDLSTTHMNPLVLPREIRLVDLEQITKSVLDTSQDALMHDLDGSWDQWSPAQQKALIADKALQRLEMTSGLSILVAADIAIEVEKGRLWAWHPEPEQDMASWLKKRGGSMLCDAMAIRSIIAPVAERHLGLTLNQILDPTILGISRLREICPESRKADATLPDEQKDQKVLDLLQTAQQSESVRALRDELSRQGGTEPPKIPYPRFENVTPEYRTVIFDDLTHDQWTFMEKRLKRFLE